MARDTEHSGREKVGSFLRSRRVWGALVVAVALAGVAADTGRAAGACPNGDCFTVEVIPVRVTPGQQGVVVGTFKNLGDASVRSVRISFALAGSVLNGTSSPYPGAKCDSTGCSLGTVPAQATATVYGRFAARSTGSATATLTFVEGTGTVRSVKSAAIVVAARSGAGGDCLFSSDPPFTLSSEDGTQNATIPFAQPSNGLPCAPVDAMFGLAPPPGFTEKLVAVDLLFDPSGQSIGTVVLDFAKLPAGKDYRSYVLYEVLNSTGASLPTYVVVAPCDPNGHPQTSNPKLSKTSCIIKREVYLRVGARLTMHVLTSVDPGYVG